MSRQNDEKIKLEKEIFKYFIDKHECKDVQLRDIVTGDPQKREPDILYNNIGFELGSVISEINKEIEKHEKALIKRMNELAKDLIPSNYLISLLFQYDKEYEIYQPLEVFKDYKYFTKYLSKIFIKKYNYDVDGPFAIEQFSSHPRIGMYPNHKYAKDIGLFINDFVVFLNNIDKNAFIKLRPDCDMINMPIWDRTTKDVTKMPLKTEDEIFRRYFSDSIIKKFSENKYHGNFDKKILLLHNFFKDEDYMSRDVNFYSHYKEYIYQKICNLIKQYNSFEIYDEIYFIDFTVSFIKADVVIRNMRTNC